MDEGRRGVAVDDVVGEEAPAGWRTEQGVGFVVGFHGLGVRMGGRMGWQWGTMAYRRACPKCGVSYESTPTDLRRFFRFRGTTGISRVGISQEVGVFARVVISE